MNWYKTILKIAVPLVDLPEHGSYFDVGHTEKENKTIFLWLIDKNYNFHKIKIEDNYPYTHHDWVYDLLDAPEMLEMRREDHEGYNALAHGRYELETHRASAAINDDDKMNELQKRYTQNKVIDILDYNFENPQIIWID